VVNRARDGQQADKWWRALGAQRASVDLDAGSVRVVASLQRVGDEVVFLPPKTDRARRTVGLPPAAIALLRRHRKEQLERRVLLGEDWADLDLVIDRGDGEPFPPDSLSRDWYRLVRRIGLPGLRLRFHDRPQTLVRDAAARNVGSPEGR
jgi:hypothetical protein